MSNPNLLAIWAKHERGEGVTNEELGHLIERFESLQDGLEQAEQITDVCRKICEKHAELRKQAEAAVARVRDLAEAWHVDSFAYDSNPLNGTLTINVSDAAKHVARALDGE